MVEAMRIDRLASGTAYPRPACGPLGRTMQALRGLGRYPTGWGRSSSIGESRDVRRRISPPSTLSSRSGFRKVVTILTTGGSPTTCIFRMINGGTHRLAKYVGYRRRRFGAAAVTTRSIIYRSPTQPGVRSRHEMRLLPVALTVAAVAARVPWRPSDSCRRAPPAPPTGLILSQVVDVVTGKPIPEATVTVNIRGRGPGPAARLGRAPVMPE